MLFPFDKKHSCQEQKHSRDVRWQVIKIQNIPTFEAKKIVLHIFFDQKNSFTKLDKFFASYNFVMGALNDFKASLHLIYYQNCWNGLVREMA